MTPFTQPGRQIGRKAMEESLTPLSRALRKFGSGKPAYPKDTPLSIVLLATEQRERLKRILGDEQGLESAGIAHTIIVVRVKADGALVPIDDWVDVDEGAESQAVRFLEEHLHLGNQFTTAGLIFIVESNGEKRRFEYKIERTPEGNASMSKVVENLVPGKTK